MTEEQQWTKRLQQALATNPATAYVNRLLRATAVLPLPPWGKAGMGAASTPRSDKNNL